VSTAVAPAARAGSSLAFPGFPTTRDEEWRFTNVAALEKARRVKAERPSVPPLGVREAIARVAYPECALAVFVDGFFMPELSLLAGLPEGVEVAGLAASASRERIGAVLDPAGKPFAILNALECEDGAVVRVPAGVVAEKPIQLLYLATATADGSLRTSYPRNLFEFGENSQATLMEHHVSVGDGASFVCGVTEIVADDRAVIEHYVLQRLNDASSLIAAQQIRVGRATSFSSHQFDLGGALARHDVGCVLAGEGADVILNGLYLVEGSRLADTHMRVEHAAPHCGSHELYKGVLDGKGRGVFNGRIFVHHGAQKTDAKQTNRNLLLSKDAMANTNPQLEIFADDVKCTHGSTVGQLDDEAVFYLRSRGIGELAAKSLLTYAFASDVIERVRLAPLKHELESYLFGWLPMGDVVKDAV
jgi:Fe-S cluster assembly protein SufD